MSEPTPLEVAFACLRQTMLGGMANKIYKEQAEALIGRDCELRAQINLLTDTVRWMAQTFHQAHHQDQPGTFRECPKNTCDAARQALDKVEAVPQRGS